MDNQGNMAPENGGANGGGATTGTIIRGADGALYFIRDEVLNSFRLPDNLARDAEALLNSGTAQGYTVDTEHGFDPLARIESDQVTPHSLSARPVPSTVMCPSFLFGSS